MKVVMLFLVVCFGVLALTSAEEPEVTGLARCLLPYRNGDERAVCLAYIPSWWHNHEKGICESFIYGGCGGNENRFATQEACDQACASLHLHH